MLLDEYQLNQVFKDFLKEYALARAINPHPIFESHKGGIALTKRLYICLLDPKWEYLNHDGKIDCEELIKKAMPCLKNGIKIEGLNYWLSDKDIPILRKICNKLFD